MYELAYRLESFNELLRTLVVFEVLDTEHDQIIVFKLTEIFDHLTLNQWFELPINHLLIQGTDKLSRENMMGKDSRL